MVIVHSAASRGLGENLWPTATMCPTAIMCPIAITDHVLSRGAWLLRSRGSVTCSHLTVTWEIWLLCLRTHNDQVLNSICSHKPLLPSSQHSGKCCWPGSPHEIIMHFFFRVLGRTHLYTLGRRSATESHPPSPMTQAFKVKNWKQECVGKHLESQHLGGRGLKFRRLKPPSTACHVWGQLRPHETLLDETK